MAAQEALAGQAWHEIVRDTLKANSVPLVAYVPDNVLKPPINAVHADNYFTAFAATREEEAVGIVADRGARRRQAGRRRDRARSGADHRSLHARAGDQGVSMISKCGYRFSDKIMRKENQ